MFRAVRIADFVGEGRGEDNSGGQARKKKGKKEWKRPWKGGGKKPLESMGGEGVLDGEFWYAFEVISGM